MHPLRQRSLRHIQCLRPTNRLPTCPARLASEYDLSLSLGIGDWDAQKWEMDCLVGFGHLRVDEQFADEQPFGTGNNEWARALDRSSHLEVREATWEQA